MEEEPLTRLDPDAAAARRRGETTPPPVAEPPPPRPLVDVRRHRWTVGIVGLAVVLGFSVYGFLFHHGDGTGVPAGRRLRYFAAPLATGRLSGVANLRPGCGAGDREPGALNLCLDARRGPLVLSLFVPQSRACERQVDALQSLADSHRYPGVQFLAVAVGTSRPRTAALVRARHWTIPVGADPDDAIGEQYGVVICPIAEIAARGGIVRRRLIGERWTTPAALAPTLSGLSAGG